QQAGDGKAFAVAHLDRGRGLSPLEGVDVEAVRYEPGAGGGVDRTDGRVDRQVDDVAVHHHRREVQLHAEGLVFDTDLTFARRDRDRVFAARQELGFLPRQRGQVRFGQGADHALGFQRLQQYAEFEGARGEAQGHRTLGAGFDRGAAEEVVDAVDV